LSDNPVAAALAALMQPGDLHPAELKLSSLRAVIDSGLTDGDKLFLINVIETYLPHEGLSNAGDEIMQALADTELSWAERIELRGKLEGERKGKREGKREGELLGRLYLIMRQLQVRFGELPADFERRLRAVDDPAVLDEIGVQALTAATLDDIELPV
jgi:predicted transposase YdaD